ncbi:hypothetical protein VJ923_11120 [Adlercreutzia sp. R25]|uniref:hypothetical protein n=1 Tax=Adlercreutzia shanghongiae TaxID=3111773 RepID=UPI002DBF8DD0|nr:hypothetical protein [Adlercreutzia sp. R25]MEC4273707.1 hypothetical protein [Adlercreutzia sp. R25]
MTENTSQTPGTEAGHGPEGRELERESLAFGEPARTAGDIETASAGDDSEMLGEVLQSQALNPNEPAVTNNPVPLEGAAPAGAAAPAPTASAAGYAADGRALEQHAVSTAYPSQPGAPAPQQPAPQAAAHQAAYQATYGAPQQAVAPRVTATASPHAAATAAAVRNVRKPLDPAQIFSICGMVVGAIIMVFGLCMLAYYTPDAAGSMFDSYQMNGSAGFSSTGATSAQVIKGGFAMLLIGFGATDICAFGAKCMKTRGHGQK